MTGAGKGQVELSRGGAAAVLELIYARRKHERLMARTRKMLVSVGVLALAALVLCFILRGELLRDRLVSLPFIRSSVPQAAKSYGPPVKVEEGEFFYQDGRGELCQPMTSIRLKQRSRSMPSFWRQ